MPRYPRRFSEPLNEKEHYAAHQAEIDVLRQAYQCALVDAYGFHAEYVLEKYTLKYDPHVIRGHYDEQTVDDLARRTFKRYYKGKDANNPAIFARHMVTDKPLPPDYPYNSLMQKIVQTPAQQVIRLYFYVVGGAALYSMFVSAHVVSAAWGYWGGIWSVLLALFMTLWLLYSAAPARGGINYVTPFAPQSYLQILSVFPVLVAAFWLAGTQGIAALGNAIIGQPEERTYSYHTSINMNVCAPYTMYVDSPAVGGSGIICLKQKVFRNIPRRGWVKVTGKASWFAIRIEDYTVSPIRLDGLQTEELKNLADKDNWFDSLLDQVNAPTELPVK